MIGRRDVSRLGDFRRLEEITTGKNIVDDLYDCEAFLMYLPKTLTKVKVVSFCMDKKKVHDSSSSGDNRAFENTISFDCS